MKKSNARAVLRDIDHTLIDYIEEGLELDRLTEIVETYDLDDDGGYTLPDRGRTAAYVVRARGADSSQMAVRTMIQLLPDVDVVHGWEWGSGVHGEHLPCASCSDWARSWTCREHSVRAPEVTGEVTSDRAASLRMEWAARSVAALSPAWEKWVATGEGTPWNCA